MRASKDVPCETIEGSLVVRVDNTMRVGHLLQLLPLTIPEEDEYGNVTRKVLDYLLYQHVAAYMAMKHFNDRNSEIVPGLADRIKSCDFYFTMEIVDTRFEILVASQSFYETMRRHHSLSTPKPIGIIGAYSSAESKPLAVLGGAFQTPQISASSTSSDLDQKFDAPFFSRTVPTNKGDSHAVILYLQSLGVTHLAVTFVRDSFGLAYHSGLIAAASAAHIHVLSSPFEEDDEDSMRSAVERVAASQFKYVFSILSQGSWKIMLNEAFRLGIAGNPEYVWFVGEGVEFIDINVDPQQEPGLAAAIEGLGVFVLQIPVNMNLANALENFRTNQQMQEEFIAAQSDRTIYDTYNISSSKVSSGPYELFYDAVLTFGIAACDTPGNLFTGQEFYDQIKQTTFEGASGVVNFDPFTGTRLPENLIYAVYNYVKNEADSTSTSTMFDVVPAILVQGDKITVAHQYVYAGNGLVAPQSLPVYSVETNLIPVEIRAVGWVLALSVILLSSLFIYWTMKNRKQAIIRASQPTFLCKICVGTIIMAFTIIPLSLQEPTRGLNISCMAIPWIFTTGFVTSFSSLLAKQWRINVIFQTSGEMRRVEIKAKDAYWIFAALLTINYAILLVWTIIAPLQWTRVPVDNFDSFGRSVESYGTCWRTESPSQMVFLIVLVVINILVIIFANYQSYLSRNIPSDFNESMYVALSMASILEALLIGIPIITLSLDVPTATFVVASLVIAILCFAILLPLFIPKLLKKTTRINRTELNQYWKSHRSHSDIYVESSVYAIRQSIRERDTSGSLML